MRAVIQRVSKAVVRCGGDAVGEIGYGFLVLLGVAADDSEADAAALAEKVAGLRIFDDADGKMNRALADVGGSVLVVSQFTLLGDCRKGRRPSFSSAARPETAERLYLHFADLIRAEGFPVATGSFGRHMEIDLVNDGPVTLLLDSRRAF